MLRLTSTLADLAQVYPWLDRMSGEAGVDGATLAHMHVALEEAVANAALHGFAPGVVGAITVRLGVLAHAVVLEVEDNGTAFDPVSAAIPRQAATLADVEPGGWGLRLIRRFCAHVGYERRDGLNCLTMRFVRAADSTT